MGKRRKIPKGQINRRNNQTIQALKNLMEDLGQKYSIRVGIIGEQAYEQHPHTDLTNAQLGAIHEFGTDTIPARSFLRDTLLSSNGKRILLNIVTDVFHKENYSRETLGDEKFMEILSIEIGTYALRLVQEAFAAGGYPKKWQDVTNYTRKHRRGAASNKPLTDEGTLRDSITVEVKKHG